MKYSLTVIVSFLLLCACGSREQKDYKTIAVTDDSMRWLCERIVGEGYEVVSLIPSGADTESYEPEISAMRDLSRADIYFTANTIGFEQSVNSRIGVELRDLKVIDISTEVPKITDTHNHAGNRHDADSHDHDDIVADPHLTGSVRNMKLMAKAILDSSVKEYPVDSIRFHRNYNVLIQRLDSLDAAISGKVDPEISFMVMHPVLSYFARDYDLRQINVLDEGKESSPVHFRRNILRGKDLRPEIFLVEKGSDILRAKEIADFVGCTTGEFTINSYSWFEDMKSLAELLAKVEKDNHQ